MGSHTENMQKVVDMLKDSRKERFEFQKERFEAERQRKEDFGTLIEGVKSRVQEIQDDTRRVQEDARTFLKEFRKMFQGVVEDIRGGAKVFGSFKSGAQGN